jgi:hypothetical protein
MDRLSARHKRILPAITAYAFEQHRHIDEALFVDMVGDILSYARMRQVDPQQVCRKVEVTVGINSHCPSEKKE